MNNNKFMRVIEPCAFLGGILFGFIFPQFSDTYKAIGSVYINLLKLLALPILMCMVFGAVAKIKEKSHLLWRVLVVFIVMFGVTFLLTAAAVSIFRPGYNTPLPTDGWEGEKAVFSLSTFLSKIIPSNFFSSLSAGDFLPCILFAAAAGYAARKTDVSGLINWMSDVEKVLLKLLEYVMYLTPIGVFLLMAASASTDGAAVIGTGLKYIIYAWALCALAFIIVMLLPVCLIRRISPITYLKKIRRIVFTTISTCSSAATLPITIDVCRNEFEIDEDICGITAPLGCTIHMCGGAVSFCLLAFFTLQMENIPVNAGLFLLMIFSAEVINMAAPGIPGGGILIGASYLSLLGAPLTIMGLYSGIYRFLDMAYTTLNVLGDVTANVILQKIHSNRTGEQHEKA